MLAFGIETPSRRVLNFNSLKGDLMRRLKLNLVEEVREHATLWASAYQQQTARFYDKQVKPSTLMEGDYVLKKFI